MKQEFIARENMLKEKCLVCKKRFKLGERFILCPIQESSGEFYINAMAVPIHTKCYYVENK